MDYLAQWLDSRLATRQRNRILQRFPQKSGLSRVKSVAEARRVRAELRALLAKQATCGRRAILYMAPHPYCLASRDYEACGFCTFPHERFIGKRNVSRAVHHVIREAEFYADDLVNCPVDAVYFGGGTANLLSGEALGGFFRSVRKMFPLAPRAEVTFEGMPSLFSRTTLETFAEIMSGLDLRISVGVQSFDESKLALMGRVWQKESAPHHCVRVAQELGIRVSLDLIFNLPGQSLADLESDVDRAADLLPEHLTFFDLVVGQGVDSSWSRSPEVMAQLISPRECYERWQILGEMLSARGYRRISKSDFEYCSHKDRGQYVYERLWKRPDTHTLLGLGYEGMSTLFEPNLRNGLKVVNHRSQADYAASIDRDVAPTVGVFRYQSVDVLLHELCSQLETGRIDCERLQSLFGVDLQRTFSTEVELLRERGLAVHDEGGLRLTPFGMFYVDSVQALFCRSRVQELKGIAGNRVSPDQSATGQKR